MEKVIFDCETTCADAATARIIQLAIIVVDEQDAIILNKVNTIDPCTPISPEATAVHGITDDMVKGKPIFKDYAKALKKIFEDKIIIGYNSIRFDIPVLLNEFERAGMDVDLSGNFIDVMKIETKLNPRTLSQIYKNYSGKELDGAHDASADTLATKFILDEQMKLIDKPTLDVLLEMSDMKDVADYFGKLKYDSNGFLIFNFGKKCFGKRVIDEREYCSWVLNEPFPRQVKNLILEEQKKHLKLKK